MRVRENLGLIVRLLAGLLLLAGLAWVARAYASAHFSPARLRDFMDNMPVSGPLVFIAVYAVAPLFLFPASLLTASAGVLWDWQWGLLFAVIGNNLCANLGFATARLLGQDRIQRLTRGKLRKYDKKLEGAGFKAIALLRMLPVMPFSTLSYTAGVSRIRWRDFALGHALGTLPGTTIFVLILEAAVE